MSRTTPGRRVMIVTGEASGDLHGAKVIRATRELSSEITFFGVGGRHMAASGCEILIPGEDLAVMGLVEVLEHFPVIWRSFQMLKRILHSDDRPDALVLIDFPEFNLRLARQARRVGVPVLYYVSPQVWAWRRGRTRKIARIVNRLAAIFPFEPDLYRGLDIEVEYVGHPLLDEFRIDRDRQTFLTDHGIPCDREIIGLFPGSRPNELKYMLETLVDTARMIRSARPEAHFLVPVAASLDRAAVIDRFDPDLPVTFIDAGCENIYDTAGACDVVVTVSGTVTLQIALSGTPMVIFYKMAPLTYAIGKRLVRVEHVGLVNIVANRRVVPELIQSAATPQSLAAAVQEILDDSELRQRIQNELLQLRERLGEPGCSQRVAGMLLNMLKSSSE